MNGEMNNNKNMDFNHDDGGNSVKRRKVKNDEDNNVNNENDLIKLKVQGVVLGEVERKVLMQGPDDSYFVAQCSNRWSDKIDNRSGSIMITLNDYIFDMDLIKLIVNFLSKKLYQSPFYPARAFNEKVPENKKKQFNEILKFLGLKSFLYPFNFMKEDMIAELVGVHPNYEDLHRKNHDNLIAELEGVHPNYEVLHRKNHDNPFEFFSIRYCNTPSKFIAVQLPLDYCSMEEGFFWKLRLGDVAGIKSYFVGIIGDVVPDDPAFSYNHKTSYGWNSRNIGHNTEEGCVFKEGMRQYGPREENDWIGLISNECLYFQLKLNKLSMFSEHRKKTFVIDGINMANNIKYYIHCNILTYSSDQDSLFTLNVLCEEEIARLLENGAFQES